MKKLFVSLLGAALVSGMFATPFASGTAQAEEKINIRIVGAVLGGAVNRSYAAFAQAFMKAYPGSNVDILPGGAVGNNSRMQKGEGEFSHTQSVLLRSASNGTEPYKKPHDKLRSLFRIGDECRLNFIALDSAPFKSFKEIRDKKMKVSISMSQKGTPSELFGRWVLNAYGITYDDIKKWGGSIDFSAYGAVANAMKDKQIQLMAWCGPGEPVMLQEVALSQKLRWIPIDDPKVAEEVTKKGLFQTVVKGKEFNGMVGSDVPVMSDVNEIFTTIDTPEDLVYKMVKVWFENYKDIAAANPGWACFDPKKAVAKTTLEMHPGAVRYFKEAGLIK